MEIWHELSKSKIFSGIDDANIKALNFCFKSRLKFCEKNEIIASEGDNNEYCIYILSGGFRAEHIDFDGNENIVKYYKTGDIFGLNEAYLKTNKYNATLIANEKSSVILFNRHRFITPCENRCPRHSQLIRNLTQILAEENCELDKKIEILTKRTIREKVLCLLNSIKKSDDSPYFDIPFSRQEMANYLSVDRCALSIELSKMKKENLIDYNKNHFRIISD